MTQSSLRVCTSHVVEVSGEAAVSADVMPGFSLGRVVLLSIIQAISHIYDVS